MANTIDPLNELRRLQDNLATAKESKQTEWICYYESAIEDLWNRNLIERCDCGAYTVEKGPCNRCQWAEQIQISDEQQYLARHS